MNKLKYLFFTISVILMLAGCGAQNKDLTCSKTFSDNNKHVFKYSFIDGKAYLIDMALTIPANEIADATVYENEFKKINAVTGCTGRFTKNDDGSYTTHQVCNLSEMSDSDVKDAFMNTRDTLEIARKDIIKNYEHDEAMKCE